MNLSFMNTGGLNTDAANLPKKTAHIKIHGYETWLNIEPIWTQADTGQDDAGRINRQWQRINPPSRKQFWQANFVTVDSNISDITKQILHFDQIIDWTDTYIK